MALRKSSSQPVSLTEMPNITPGTWVFEPGDSGDDSVGLQGYAPTVQVEIPGREGDFVVLAEIREPIYSARLEDIKNSDPDYEFDTGERYLQGNPSQNGLLMAGAPGLLSACQKVLGDLYDEHRQKSGGLFSPDLRRIQSHILVLETAIKQAIIFPES